MDCERLLSFHQSQRSPISGVWSVVPDGRKADAIGPASKTLLESSLSLNSITPHRLLLVDAAAALGIASLAFLWTAAPLVEPKHLALYHWSGSPADLFLPVILNLLAFTAIFTGLLRSARRPGRWQLAVWSGFLLFLPFIVLKNWELIDVTVPTYGVGILLFGGACAAWALLLLLWRPRFAPALAHLVQFSKTLFVFLGISGLCLLVELAWFGWEARGISHHETVHREQSVPVTAKGRILWIVFDELSFQQVYETRFPGVQLPAFDALAQESTLFTRVVPAGMQTEEVLPSLMIGRRVDALRSSSAGLPVLAFAGSPSYRPWNQYDTVFADAQRDGYRTAVAGWYNPYCRLMPQVVDDCFWSFDTVLVGGTTPANGIWSNLFGPASYLLELGSAYRLASRYLPLEDQSARFTDLHQEDFVALDAAADRILRDPSDTFALLHLPVPHPGGIYDRHTGKLSSTSAGYEDNLVLADRCLASIRSMEQQGTWDSSTIVVMGDHSWRTLGWRTNTIWTREEEQASFGGKFDDRPAYIVKLPLQHVSATIDVPFPATATRALLDELLAHRIQTSAELKQWVEYQAPAANDSAPQSQTLRSSQR